MNQSIANPMIASPAGSMMQGMQYGTQVQDMRRQNALRSVLQEVGPAIAAGDTNALARVYQVAPDVALELQRDMETRQREGVRFDREGQRFEMQLKKFQMELDQFGKTATAEEKQAVAENTARIALTLRNTPPDQLPQAAAEAGFPDLSTPQRVEAAINAVLPIIEVWKAGNDPSEPKPGNDYERYVARERAAGREPLDEFGYANAKRGKGTVVYDPTTGNPLVSIGGASQSGEMSVGDVYNPGEVMSTIALIDEIFNDPNLDKVVGPLEGGGGNDIEQLNAAQRLYYGEGGLSVIEKINQLQSRSWMAARQMLKGGGPITDYESRKAEAAVARLSRAKGEKEYREALTELRDAITEGMAKLEAASGGTAPPAASPPPSEPGAPITGMDAAAISQMPESELANIDIRSLDKAAMDALEQRYDALEQRDEAGQ